MSSTNFRRLVWAFYKKNGRHDLPWRQTIDLYEILVSEVMLQQTQVERVIPLYTNFIKQFPTAKNLAETPLADVLRAWQGLGYNRRAKMLWEAVQQSSLLLKTPTVHLSSYRTKYEDEKLVEMLERLPGVGPYTARAVAAFACNADVVVIETNIRTVIIHHFFPGRETVTDEEIGAVLATVLPKGRAREWYSALMDYGAHLKRSGISHNVRTKQYTKQSVFKGSLREVRGAVLRALAEKSAGKSSLIRLGFAADKFDRVLADLCAEGLIEKRGRQYALATGSRE